MRAVRKSAYTVGLMTRSRCSHNSDKTACGECLHEALDLLSRVDRDLRGSAYWVGSPLRERIRALLTVYYGEDA
jgi:hypothetical protein